VGIVVPDMEAGIESFSTDRGEEWLISGDGPRSVSFLGPSGELTITHRTAWSRRRPFHLELIQAISGTIWEPRLESYLHHLGYWVNDFDKVADRALRAGMRLELTRPGGPSGRPSGFGYYRMASGILVEFVDRATSASVRMLSAPPTAGEADRL
jgi:catechol 2,3-dioxygenase-like lactoylglutathione lyase family enzyme